MTPDIRIEPATQGDANALLALMERAHLPADGLRDHLDAALVARDGDRIVGSAAIEVYADGGLVRSVAVDADHRGVEFLGVCPASAAVMLKRLDSRP